MDGNSYRMQPNWTYLFNQYCMHGVVNEGIQLRIHLVWDCYLNDYIVNELIRAALDREAQAALG